MNWVRDKVFGAAKSTMAEPTKADALVETLVEQLSDDVEPEVAAPSDDLTESTKKPRRRRSRRKDSAES